MERIYSAGNCFQNKKGEKIMLAVSRSQTPILVSEDGTWFPIAHPDSPALNLSALFHCPDHWEPINNSSLQIKPKTMGQEIAEELTELCGAMSRGEEIGAHFKTY